MYPSLSLYIYIYIESERDTYITPLAIEKTWIVGSGASAPAAPAIQFKIC